MTHTITGSEPFLNLTLARAGVPALHIIRAYNTHEYRFYELTGDLPEALHFNHFEKPGSQPSETPLSERIHLGEEVEKGEAPANPASGRITLKD